jgi:DNA polymerase-3 subunit epsilon
VADEFLEFIQNKKIVIHNAEFDITHLNNELSMVNKKSISQENVIDTLEIARNKFPGSGISLDALCKRYRIDNTRRKNHTALLDCELLAKVYINLIDQKEPIFKFSEEVKEDKKDFNRISNYSKKIINISNDELRKHKEFLKKDLKKNFY